MTRPGAAASAHLGPAHTEVTPVYRFGRFMCRLWLRCVHRLEVSGSDNVPSQGGILLVCNHQSFLDIPVVASGLSRHVAFVARDTLARSRFLSFWMRGAGTILVRRGAPDRAALEAMVDHLRRGDCVAVFPEGTRSMDGSLGSFRPGALFAARRAGVPVVPVGIRGAMHALPRGARVPRPRRIGVRFGAPLDPLGASRAGGPGGPGGDEALLERAHDAIAELIGDGAFTSAPEIP